MHEASWPRVKWQRLSWSRNNFLTACGSVLVGTISLVSSRLASSCVVLLGLLGFARGALLALLGASWGSLGGLLGDLWSLLSFSSATFGGFRWNTDGFHALSQCVLELLMSSADVVLSLFWSSSSFFWGQIFWILRTSQLKTLLLKSENTVFSNCWWMSAMKSMVFKKTRESQLKSRFYGDIKTLAPAQTFDEFQRKSWF